MRIAIVGAGISGLVCAHQLHPEHQIEVFEASAWVGGHTHTVNLELDGVNHSVDTGFIVYNERNYPLFTRLLAELGVATQATTMGFGFRSDITGIEYGGGSLRALAAQPGNLLRPRFLRMLRDIPRFFRSAQRLLESSPDPSLSLGRWLAREKFSEAFCSDHLLPMGGAIWSTPPERVRDFPAEAFLRFFKNHGLLSLTERPAWRVIQGGSHRYVEALTKAFRERIHTGCPVAAVRRDPAGVELITEDGTQERFDAIILACHSDQARAMLVDPTPVEDEILGAISYQTNDVVLHTDASILPRSPHARSAWNYRTTRDGHEAASVTYDMSLLQALPTQTPILVTLNQTTCIDSSKVIEQYEYEHPVFDAPAIRAQKRHNEVLGPNHTYYAGAYWGHGFHEDGVASAHRALAALTANASSSR